MPINAGVWRFHPLTGDFERYCEGASNQWGIDWNDRGQAFFAACVIPHVWQCMQGGRYQRQAGQPSNPHTYDDLKSIGDFEYEKRAYCGAMIYLGGLFPAEWRDTFFFNDIHMNKVRNEKMVRAGSGYRAERNVDFLVPAIRGFAAWRRNTVRMAVSFSMTGTTRCRAISSVTRWIAPMGAFTRSATPA